MSHRILNSKSRARREMAHDVALAFNPRLLLWTASTYRPTPPGTRAKRKRQARAKAKARRVVMQPSPRDLERRIADTEAQRIAGARLRREFPRIHAGNDRAAASYFADQRREEFARLMGSP